MTMRYRITVRGTGITLRGWIDGDEKVREFAGALATLPGWPDDPMLAVSPDPDPQPILLTLPLPVDDQES